MVGTLICAVIGISLILIAWLLKIGRLEMRGESLTLLKVVLQPLDDGVGVRMFLYLIALPFLWYVLHVVLQSLRIYGLSYSIDSALAAFRAERYGIASTLLVTLAIYVTLLGQGVLYLIAASTLGAAYVGIPNARKMTIAINRSGRFHALRIAVYCTPPALLVMAYLLPSDQPPV